MLLALDIVLQVAVLVVATDSSLKDGLDEIAGARCWSVYSDAKSTLDGIAGDLEMVLVFGGFEMAIVILAAIAAIIDRVPSSVGSGPLKKQVGNSILVTLVSRPNSVGMVPV